VHVGVMRHGRTPRVQHGSYADPGAEPALVGSNRERCFGGSLKQNVIDDRLIGVGEIRNRGRQRVDDVEVGYRQKLGLALLEPVACRRALALGAVPVAAANGRRPLAALWAKPVMGS
jgi:hypothetical protein